MLMKENQGKVLSESYTKKRNRGIENFERVGSKYNWLDLEFPQGHGKDDDRTYEIRSRVYHKKIDIRKRKGLGESEDEII